MDTPEGAHLYPDGHSHGHSSQVPRCTQGSCIYFVGSYLQFVKDSEQT